MNKIVYSSGFTGVETFLVSIEVDISKGLPSFTIIGQGDTSINESKERVKTALKNIDMGLEPRKVVVNLSPANIPKTGSHLDLGIAIGLIVSSNYIKDCLSYLENYIFLGELSLEGKIQRVDNAIGTAILASEKGFKGLILPLDNIQEVELISGLHYIPITTLGEVISLLSKEITKEELYLKNRGVLEDNFTSKLEVKINEYDFREIKGQSQAKRALEIAAAGGHNILLVGSPGSGKTMLANAFSTILPPLTLDEMIESTKIYSAAGQLSEKLPFIATRQIRAPHHTTTLPSMVGGGRIISPGEITLAHNGILFLDEFFEFKGTVIDALREPLESKKISISRIGYKVIFPANFTLIAAANPCFCGYYFDDPGRCTCTASELLKYERKISGPILDRIDLFIKIKRISDGELLSPTVAESSRNIFERVSRARELQSLRLGQKRLNSELKGSEIDEIIGKSNISKEFLKKIISKFLLTGRSFHKIIRIARTIADLDNSLDVKEEHILESLSYRK